MKDPEFKQRMLKVDGKSFYCSCGCNVFTEYSKEKYKCNSCDTCYESEISIKKSENKKKNTIQCCNKTWPSFYEFCPICGTAI